MIRDNYMVIYANKMQCPVLGVTNKKAKDAKAKGNNFIHKADVL